VITERTLGALQGYFAIVTAIAAFDGIVIGSKGTDADIAMGVVVRRRDACASDRPVRVMRGHARCREVARTLTPPKEPSHV